MTSLVSRNIYVNGRRTSMRLELEVWAALEEIGAREGRTTSTLRTFISKHPRRGSFTSVIETFALLYCRELVTILEQNQRRNHAFAVNLINSALAAIKYPLSADYGYFFGAPPL